MATRYFMIFGSPGSYQVGGPPRCGHHSGWIEVDTFIWPGPVAHGQAVHDLVVLLREDAVSPRMFLHARPTHVFDVVTVDIWDDSAKRSQGTIEFYRLLIKQIQREAGREGPAIDAFFLNYVDVKMNLAATTKTAGIGLTTTQMALARAAIRTPTATQA